MAKDDREIVSAVRMPETEAGPRVTYKPGMEDELAAVATKEQLDAWLEAGVITGGWSTKKAPAGDESKSAKKGK